MHILFLSHYFPPEVNAPATRTYEHAKEWVEKGHKVTVITCAPNCPDGVVYQGFKNKLFSINKVDGIKVIRIWTFIAANKGFARRILNYISYMISAILSGLFQKKVDVIVATSPQFFCGWAGVILHWIRRWPFVLEIRDIWPESILTVGAMKKSPLITLLEKLEKIMYKSADKIIAVGNGYKNKIVQRGISKSKIAVIINGVNVDQFKKPNNLDHVKKKYNSEGKFICSYVGTVGMAHGLEVVLKAATIDKIEDTNVVYWIVGDGANRKALQLEAENLNLNNVVFTGRLPKEQMPEIISASDACLVHLKGSELFSTVIPSKIFECMALETPIIMGVRGESQKYVLDAKAGVAMEPDEPASLIKCVKTIKRKRNNAFTAKKIVEEKFNRKILAGKMLKELKLVCTN